MQNEKAEIITEVNGIIEDLESDVKTLKSKINHIKKQRKKYSFDARETWNLNHLFCEWLYSHLMMYKEIACVDLSAHIFEFEGTQYTQGEMIDLILQNLKIFLQSNNLKDEAKGWAAAKKAIRMWAEVCPACWW